MTAHQPVPDPARSRLSSTSSQRDLRTPMLAGAAVGVLQALTPFAFWWLPAATVYGMGVAVIAAIYIGFSVADGRPKVIAVESVVAGGFLVVAAAGVTGTAWLLVAGLVAHGLKDYWQHRTQFVANTRWWPPFCAVVDVVVAGTVAVAILTGIDVSS
ncbi:hypothetical protein SAMN04487968_11529 [Nocardioides terrae]|uniref:Uncharacterized protein n=1 Tax=Nocardioides terrae TaxID=574651 RepID=A0A1I1N839_9ACTN|nr:hypothetical protein [Nocardioides terrae]SFC93884.1 hypothetical protein SAMN04487968_11529 [Nocardioides terrae]